MKKSWVRCKCGVKLHAKSGVRQCYKCKQKEMKRNV